MKSFLGPPTQYFAPSQLAILAFVAGVPLLLWLGRNRVNARSISATSLKDGNDAAATDPGLLKKHSSFNSYHVPKTGFTYKSIRTFYRAHPQTSKLPSKPFPLPLLVFVHGLGGSAAQFAPLLTSLVNVGPCLCIDLPGCGLSAFSPDDWNAYTIDALVQLLAVVIEKFRNASNSQGVIFVGHSLGCSLAALLASTNSKDVGEIPERTLGLIAICPRASRFSQTQENNARGLLHIPTPIFDLWRMWDRRGGQQSRSVARFVGEEAENEAKRLQVRFNDQSRSDVWRRMAYGLLPQRNAGKDYGGLPSDAIWEGLDVPVFLIAGESDPITPPGEMEKIFTMLQSSWKDVPESEKNNRFIPEPPKPNERVGSSPQTISPEIFAKPPRALKTTILSAPASHALMYAPTTCRTISGLIQSFLGEHIDKRLSLGWQLQYLSTEGKWDVKNLVKWQAVDPISEPIGGVFRAMKTMREVDESHCPTVFAQQWKDKVYAVVDISHENPVYDPSNLEKGGIEYHKFPTVSKLPPSAEEMESFIELIDRLREPVPPRKTGQEDKTIAVHCHYGFNRTGFFIVGYLVEKMGWRLQDAVDMFEKVRPPGIKHDYFIDTLYVRYHVGLKKRPTL